MISRKLLAAAVALTALASACTPSNTGGLDLHGKPHVGKKEPPPPTPPPGAIDPAKPDANEARHLAWQAIGCFIGGPWSEALGASGEERILEDTKRCREIATGPLGAKPEDEKSLDAVRNVDVAAVAKVLEGLQRKYGDKRDEKMLALVRATADAAREAQAARRVAEDLRASKTKEPTEAEANALATKDALAALDKVGTDEAKLVQLVLGADRVESSRGLSPRPKILAASAGLAVVFAVPSPKPATDAKQGDWVTFLMAAAKSAGHAPKTEPSASLDDQEQSAFTGVAEGFADRFEALAQKLSPSVAKGAANGYAARLRTELADAAAKQKAAASKKKKPETATPNAPKNVTSP
jgi:hypothetical protein